MSVRAIWLPLYLAVIDNLGKIIVEFERHEVLLWPQQSFFLMPLHLP